MPSRLLVCDPNSTRASLACPPSCGWLVELFLLARMQHCVSPLTTYEVARAAVLMLSWSLLGEVCGSFPEDTRA